MATWLPCLPRGALDFGVGPAVAASGPQAGLAGRQGGCVADGQRGALGCPAREPFLFEFGGQVQVINVFQGPVVLPEDVAGQAEEEDHRVDADDGEDVPGGARAVREPQGPGGAAAVPPLGRVPQQVRQGVGSARLRLVGGSPGGPLGY